MVAPEDHKEVKNLSVCCEKCAGVKSVRQDFVNKYWPMFTLSTACHEDKYSQILRVIQSAVNVYSNGQQGVLQKV